MDQLLGRGISNLKSALDHLSLQQAVIGAQVSKAEVQRGALASRKLAVSQDISKIGDADLAKLVTELQSQLTNRDAAQQALLKLANKAFLTIFVNLSFLKSDWKMEGKFIYLPFLFLIWKSQKECFVKKMASVEC